MVIFLAKINYGRKRIILDYDEVTPDNFKEVFSKAFPIFKSNQRDCRYLIKMFLGDQDILKRPAPNTSNINNKTVVNYAYPITREIVGYTFGNPFELVQKDTTKQKDVQVLSDICDYEGAYAVDISTAIYASICGFGYEITLPSPEISEDNTPEVPIVLSTLNPEHTFVVQSTSIGNPQIMSCIEVVDSTRSSIKYIAFTNKYKFTIDVYKNDIQNADKIKVENSPVGLDPITMVENSLLLTGDWETAIPIMNALNQVTSDSLNDIEGTIKSLLVLIGTEIDDENTTLSMIKDKRLLSLYNGNGQSGQLDAKFIAPKLDSAEVTEIRKFLNEARNVITGIPDRQASVGGDTGAAVINRNGWTDIEIVARLKELYFKKAKKKQVAVALKILQDVGKVDKSLKVMDIDINLGRNTLDNLSVKASAFSTLVATGELATIDALDFSGLTNRTDEVVARGEAAKQKRIEENLKLGVDPLSVNGNGGKYNYNYSYDKKSDDKKVQSVAEQPTKPKNNGNSNKTDK